MRTAAWLAGSMLLVGLATGGRVAAAAERRPVWERLDQFVAVEKQDGGPGTPATRNDHPARATRNS